MPISRSAGVAIMAVAALVLLPWLGEPPLWDDDEPRNAACSLAMLGSGDWVVPTFSGQLRIEKPALVNWLQLAGFAVAGVNETGARLASALLTIGSCLLTGMIAARLFRPDVGAWAGIVMATFLWTGIGGRAATPDAPLVFCTTLALWIFVRGCRLPTADGSGWRDAPVCLGRGSALGVGAACGLAMLAKGPVGLLLPLLGLGGFCWWQTARDPGRTGPPTRRIATSGMAALRSLKLPTIVAAAAAVALPWYVAVTLRTDGEWLRGFLLVHNVGRFAAPMEGHSGSAWFYFPMVVLIGTFPWSMASALIARHAACQAARATSSSVGMRLVICWIAAWVVPFSISGTKLPGYVWPAYPAFALAGGLFVADWIRDPSPFTDRWMRVAWGFLAASGLAIAIGLPVVSWQRAPGLEWLGLIGLLPVAGAVMAWCCQSLSSRIAATSVWAATACGTVALLLALPPAILGHAGGARDLVAHLQRRASAPIPIATFGAPASAAFYGGRLTPCGAVEALDEPAAAAEFVAEHPGAHLVVDARYEEQVAAALPPDYRVLRATTTFPRAQQVLLLGPSRDGPSRQADPPERLAADPDAAATRR